MIRNSSDGYCFTLDVETYGFESKSNTSVSAKPVKSDFDILLTSRSMYESTKICNRMKVTVQIKSNSNNI